MVVEFRHTSEIASLSGQWKAVAGAYLAEVAQRTGSARTPQEYARYIERFLGSIDDPADATPAQLHAFAYGPGVSGKMPSSSTVGVRLAALRGFYDFARRMRLLERNPADDVKRPKAQEPTPRGLNADELQRLLLAVPATPSGARDKALIITAVLTGLRRAELLALRAGDLEWRDGAVFYRVRTKGGSVRHRELPAPAFDAIEHALWLQATPLESLPDDAPLFAISSHGFYKNLKTYAERADLKDVTPHVLRHAAAKLRRDTGASIEAVGSFLGHRSLHTTSRYLARLEGEHDPGWKGVADALGLRKTMARLKGI
jgi:site-specific recombinase XerD